MRHHITTTVALVTVIAVMIGTASAGPQARLGGTVVGTDGEPIVGAVITITSEALPKYKKTIDAGLNGCINIYACFNLDQFSWGCF